MCATVFNAYVKLVDERLELYLFSDKLPPLLSMRRNAKELFNALSKVFGYTCNDGVKTIVVKPLYVPAVLVWTVASLTLGPRVEVLEKLISGTPVIAVELIFESIDAGRAYREKGPLIPKQRLVRVSRKVVGVLGFDSEGRAYRSGVI